MKIVTNTLLLSIQLHFFTLQFVIRVVEKTNQLLSNYLALFYQVNQFKWKCLCILQKIQYAGYIELN